MRKALVCGGRNYSNRDVLFQVMDAARDWHSIGSIIHGAARGADRLAGDWAKARNVLFQEFPADWMTHGKAAGPIRNQRMLDEGKPDFVLAFEGGAGTNDMMLRAFRVPIWVFRVEGTSWMLISKEAVA